MSSKPVDDFRFGVGDVVRLTGGADKMTVIAPADEDDGRVGLLWHDADGVMHEAAVDPAALVLVRRGVDARLR